MPATPSPTAPPPPPDPAIRRRFWSRIRWAVGLAVFLGFAAWFVTRGGFRTPDIFIASTVAPEIHGVVEGAADARCAVVILVPASGFSAAVSDRAAALRRLGALTFILDYYRGGKDSYHGYTSESSEALELKWQTNLSAGLAWAAGDRRFAHAAILAWPGRGRQLLESARAIKTDLPAWPVLDAGQGDADIINACGVLQ